MSISSRGRDAAQQRADRIRAFREELAALRSEGVELLSVDQEQQLARHHDALLAELRSRFDVDVTETAGRLSRGMQIASFFGALTLTAAVYSLVTRFWGGLDLPLQVGLLTLFPLLALAGVDLSARREPSLYIASIFAAAAYGTFWLAAIVTAQLLDLPVTPAILWLGVVFGLALATAYGFRLVLVAALLAMIVALGGTLFSVTGAPWTMVGERPEPVMIGAFGLLLLVPALEAAVPGFGAISRRVGLSVGLLALLALSAWGGASVLPLSTRWIEGIYQALMLLTSIAFIAFGLARGLPDLVRIATIGLALFLVSRYVHWFWSMLPRYLFFLLLAVAAFAWLLLLRRFRGRVRGQS